MTRAILVSGLMLVLGLPAHGQSSAVPDVVGDRLDHAILALERAGFEVEHDGGAGYRETFSPLNT